MVESRGTPGEIKIAVGQLAPVSRILGFGLRQRADDPNRYEDADTSLSSAGCSPCRPRELVGA